MEASALGEGVGKIGFIAGGHVENGTWLESDMWHIGWKFVLRTGIESSFTCSEELIGWMVAWPRIYEHLDVSGWGSGETGRCGR